MNSVDIETTGWGPTHQQDIDLGKKIIGILERYYPLHAWFVQVNHEGGHATIQLMYQGPNMEPRIWKYGYLLHIMNLEGLEGEKKVRDAGGEILERYHIARSMANENGLIDFMHKGVDTASMVK